MKNITLTEEYKNLLHKDICYENIKRNQIYSALNYIINFSTLFDFFSIDAFNLIVLTEYILTINNKKLRKLYIDKSESNNLKLLFKYKINSSELNNLLEYIKENSLLKLNLPIITIDTILFTFIDQNHYILKLKHINTLVWYLMKYSILKKIYLREILFNNINKNEKLFLFLFRSQISESSFIKLSENKNLNLAIFMFRNILISKTLKVDLNSIIKKEINISCKRNNNRNYLN